jgi:putative hydrolase
MGRMQAAMAVVEGYSEHVMDEIAAAAIPEHEALRTAMDHRRRSRSAPARLIERLLGFEIKLRQYEQGKRFCDGVVAAGGMEALNRVWESPEALPTPAELDAPEAWLERLGPAPAAAA